MSIRNARPRELCCAYVLHDGQARQCKVPTEEGCLRCGKPFCPLHRPEPGQRCYGCELDYAIRRKAVGQSVFRIALSSVVAAAISLGVLAGDGGLLLQAASLGALPAVGAERAAEVLCRRRFLSERGQIPRRQLFARSSDAHNALK